MKNKLQSLNHLIELLTEADEILENFNYFGNQSSKKEINSLLKKTYFEEVQLIPFIL